MMKGPVPSLRAPALAALAAAAWCARAAAADPDLPVHVPAGVADAEGTVVCVHTAEGGVEAVDAASGRRLWLSGAPSRALLVSRGQGWVLEERGGALRVTAYDARSGRAAGTWSLSALELPAWARLAEPREGARSRRSPSTPGSPA